MSHVSTRVADAPRESCVQRAVPLCRVCGREPQAAGLLGCCSDHCTRGLAAIEPQAALVGSTSDHDAILRAGLEGALVRGNDLVIALELERAGLVTVSRVRAAAAPQEVSHFVHITTAGREAIGEDERGAA